MTDAAQEIADRYAYGKEEMLACAAEIRKLERKAKADGIRETLKDCACGDCDDCFWRIEADKIERGEPLDAAGKAV